MNLEDVGECSCSSKNPMDYDGPDQDCPSHGNPLILGYCPLGQYAAWRAENARLRAELKENERVMRVLRRQRNEAEAVVGRVREWVRVAPHGIAATAIARIVNVES
ncbi:hypothetical protein [Streptomyces cucumeris]|uniref:hypothetical protein n=1 Tax=Streptomyces cucumeris TaxID=2962890 RepID=UPI0020C8A3EE|nr:hypothetical protein [Streptomyces sp. NEAU-Y11]MCP9209639.1 hypothetical protein [Streptomyces sp. NEAU-Y11]